MTGDAGGGYDVCGRDGAAVEKTHLVKTNRGTLQAKLSWSCGSCGAWQPTRVFSGPTLDDVIRMLRAADAWWCAACLRVAAERKAGVKS